MAIDFERIIEGCIDEDRKCQQQLYQYFAPKMMGVCMRYSKDQNEAEDILQDAFVKVFTNIHKYQPFGPFEGWVRRIFVNTAIEYYRQRKKYVISELEIENEEFEYREDVLDKLAAEEILALMKKMPDGYRVVFNMYAIEGYSHKEIAEQLDISIGTSKSQYSRARTFLQKLLSQLETSKLGKKYANYER